MATLHKAPHMYMHWCLSTPWLLCTAVLNGRQADSSDPLCALVMGAPSAAREQQIALPLHTLKQPRPSLAGAARPSPTPPHLCRQHVAPPPR
eukprot:137932-Chlamydomonas_euryale.AAC.1